MKIKNHVGYKIQQSGNFESWSYSVSIDNAEYYIAKIIRIYDSKSDMLLEEYTEPVKTPILSDRSYKNIVKNNKYYNKEIYATKNFYDTYKN